MSEESNNNEEFKNDILAQALRFRTVWTNTLFEKGNDVITISRFGKINIRIEKAVIIWTVVGILISLLLTFTIFKWIVPQGFYLLVGVVFGGIFTILLVQIGLWSPMRKTTGEDLITYLKFMARNKISSGGFFAKQAESTYISRAFKNSPEGRAISGKMWLGTQPLPTAVPKSLDNKSRLEFQFYQRGEMNNVDIGRYNSRGKHRRMN